MCVLGFGLALAGLLHFGSGPSRLTSVAQAGSGDGRVVSGNMIISMVPATPATADPRPVKDMSELLRFQELEKARRESSLLPVRDDRTMPRAAALDTRPLRPDEPGVETSRSGRTLVYLPPPGKGDPVIR
jgi:hypothetical protein